MIDGPHTAVLNVPTSQHPHVCNATHSGLIEGVLQQADRLARLRYIMAGMKQIDAGRSVHSAVCSTAVRHMLSLVDTHSRQL